MADNADDMNVLVIEYETGMAQKIKELLYEIDETIQVVGVTANMFAAAEWLTRNKIPDLILANEGMIAGLPKRRSEIKAIVTFSTNSEAYKLEAFRYKTIRHILNEMPGTEERLVNEEKLGTFDQYWGQTKTSGNANYKERFLVKQGQKLVSIHVNQIAYFFSQERFIFFKTFDNQKYLLEYRMEQLENVLAPHLFFRINRSYIVSMQTVKEIHAYFGNRLKLYLTPAADKEVIVSRKRVTDFKEWLGK